MGEDHNDPTKYYIMEEWNLLAEFRNLESHIHTPKCIIFPLTQGKMAGVNVSNPADPAGCCAYSYGEKWNVTRKKGAAYKMVVEENAPSL